MRVRSEPAPRIPFGVLLWVLPSKLFKPGRRAGSRGGETSGSLSGGLSAIEEREFKTSLAEQIPTFYIKYNKHCANNDKWNLKRHAQAGLRFWKNQRTPSLRNS